VKECIMIEPTETESRQTLDSFIMAMNKISVEIKENPEQMKNAPFDMPIQRVDEVKAARDLDIRFVKKD